MAEPDRLDEVLARTLREQPGTLADDGFSANVVRRLRQRKSLRLLSVSLASLTGLLIALMPAGRLLEKLEAGLTRLIDDLAAAQPGGVGTLLEAFHVREALTGLSEQIMSVFAVPAGSAWLAENQIAVVTALLALAATAALRLLVR